MRNHIVQEISWHVYDLDLARAYKQMQTEIARNNFHFPKNPQLKPDKYLELQLPFIQVYCKLRGIDFEKVMQSQTPLLLTNYDDLSYENFLGFCLLAFDYHKIPFFLEYQRNHFQGQADFLNLVEYLTYEYVKENSAFNLNERLGKIAGWLWEKRHKASAAKTVHKHFYKVNYQQKTERKAKKPDMSKIFDTIEASGVEMERDPRKHRRLIEIKLRDALLNPLAVNVDKQYTVTYESWKKHGRTDFLLRTTTGKDVLIGECKMWESPNKTRTELTGFLNKYLVSRDTHATFVVFSKKPQPTTVFQKLEKVLTSHKNFKAPKESKDKFRRSYNFNLPGDTKASIHLELFFFSFPPPQKKRKNPAKKTPKKSR